MTNAIILYSMQGALDFNPYSLERERAKKVYRRRCNLEDYLLHANISFISVIHE